MIAMLGAPHDIVLGGGCRLASVGARHAVRLLVAVSERADVPRHSATDPHSRIRPNALSSVPFHSGVAYAPTPSCGTGTIACATKNHRRQWRDSAKFLRRARHAVPLLKYFSTDSRFENAGDAAPRRHTMSRGAQRSTRQLTDQQLAQQNQLISQSNQQGTQDRSLLLPTIQSLLTSPGYTPAEQSAITQQAWAPQTPPTTRSANAPPIAPPPPMTPPPLPNSPRNSAANRLQGLAKSSPAKSNRLRQSTHEGSARRPQRPRPNLRHRHKPPRPRHGRPRAPARRPPARFHGSPPAA